jgi:phosphate transport system permease protein
LLIVGAAAFTTFVPSGPFDKYTALPVQIFKYAADAKDEFKVLAAAGIIVLLAILIVLNSFAIRLRTKYEQRW